MKKKKLKKATSNRCVDEDEDDDGSDSHKKRNRRKHLPMPEKEPRLNNFVLSFDSTLFLAFALFAPLYFLRFRSVHFHFWRVVLSVVCVYFLLSFSFSVRLVLFLLLFVLGFFSNEGHKMYIVKCYVYDII